MKKEVIEKLSTLVTVAFGLIAALAWNSAIQEIFKKYYSAGEGVLHLVSYAIFVTCLAVVITIWIGRLSEKYSKK